MKRWEKKTPWEYFFSHLKEETTPWSLLDLLVLNEILITASDKQWLSKLLLLKLGKKREKIC